MLDVELMNWVYVLAVLGTGLWFLFEWVKWSTTNFVLTTDRIITSEGFIAKKGMEIPLDRVNTVIFNQSVFERMVGAGDLGIESAGEQGNQHLSDIRKPAIVKNEIYRQIEANENRKFDRMRSGPGADPTQVQSAPASIPPTETLCSALYRSKRRMKLPQWCSKSRGAADAPSLSKRSSRSATARKRLVLLSCPLAMPLRTDSGP